MVLFRAAAQSIREKTSHQDDEESGSGLNDPHGGSDFHLN
jgi:hypothetical protein